MTGDTEGLIKRGARLYTEVGEDFIDDDDEDEDDKTKKYNTFVVTNILKAGTHVVMQELENGEAAGCTMTSKEIGVPEIILGIKLYNSLNARSAPGGKKPARAEASSARQSPAQSGTAVVRFGLQKDFSGAEIKDSALFHTTRVDFSRWITAYSGLTSSASRCVHPMTSTRVKRPRPRPRLRPRLRPRRTPRDRTRRAEHARPRTRRAREQRCSQARQPRV